MAGFSAMKVAIGDPFKAGSLASKARQRRWQMFEERFPDIADMRVLDLGGFVKFWREMPKRPGELVIMNLDVQDTAHLQEDWARVVTGDACAPPASVANDRFDLVFSNSLIEHVGGHLKRQELADVVEELAPHHWVQTPYRYFPVEAHYLFPGFQFLPVRARAALAHRWAFSAWRSAPSEAVHDVLWVEFLSQTEMQYYFPKSEILQEKFCGLTKSIIAWK